MAPTVSSWGSPLMVTSSGVLWALRRSPSFAKREVACSSFQGTERSVFQSVLPVSLSSAIRYCTSTPSIVRISIFSNTMTDEAGPR